MSIYPHGAVFFNVSDSAKCSDAVHRIPFGLTVNGYFFFDLQRLVVSSIRCHINQSDFVVSFRSFLICLWKKKTINEMVPSF